MTHDHELTLITQAYEMDEVGNQVPVESETVILCGKKSVTRSEFYNAAVTGLKPVIVLIVHGYEYEGQKLVEFEGEKYRVVRTYEVDFETLELTCEKVTGND